MPSFIVWVKAARLRTLPLSIAGIIVGSALSMKEGVFDLKIFLYSLFTAIILQVLSNFANDYGDGTKGTDNAERVGPKRMLQSGQLTKSALKNGIVVTSILCITAIFLLIVEAFGWQEIEYIILFLFLGGCAVWAALKYTIGSSAYGYHGLGDLFVFLFFGCVAVLGNQFLYTKTLEWLYVMPALGMGFLCVAVLNLNNLRDVDSDKNAGKNTLVVKMGFKRGKKYHAFLIMASFLAFVIYSAIEWNGTSYPIYLAVWGILFIHLIKVIGTKNPVNLDPELKKVALSTLLIAILFLISVMKIL